MLHAVVLLFASHLFPRRGAQLGAKLRKASVTISIVGCPNLTTNLKGVLTSSVKHILRMCITDETLKRAVSRKNRSTTGDVLEALFEKHGRSLEEGKQMRW